jgi:hypothetical protein
MKIIKILIGLLLVANLAMAATDIEVHINYPSDSVFIGSYNKLEIWIENTDSISGISLGFEYSGTPGTIMWDLDYGIVPPINIENDGRGSLQWVQQNYGFEDNSLPDTLLVGGLWLPNYFPRLPPNSARECVSLYFYIPDSESPGQFCIDNIFVPLAGSWLVDDGVGPMPYPPSYSGCTETDGTNPTCPAVCFPVATTARPCGDINWDGVVNLSDMVNLLNYMTLLGAVPPFEYVFADVNCDGRVNIADAQFIIEYIFMGGDIPCTNCP